jgi:undecaprenyl-diphosphatase
MLVVAVAMTGLVALPLKKLAVEGLTNFRRMGLSLMAMSVVLAITQKIGRERGEKGRGIGEVRVRDAALVGLSQSFSAIFHGFSRSGNTIAVGLFTGMSRKAAAEFSFLLSIPTILAAAVVENIHAYRHNPETFSAPGAAPAYLAGMLTAAVVGYLTVSWLLNVVVSMRLTPFVVYCATLGTLLVLWPPA